MRGVHGSSCDHHTRSVRLMSFVRPERQYVLQWRMNGQSRWMICIPGIRAHTQACFRLNHRHLGTLRHLPRPPGQAMMIVSQIRCLTSLQATQTTLVQLVMFQMTCLHRHRQKPLNMGSMRKEKKPLEI